MNQFFILFFMLNVGGVLALNLNYSNLIWGPRIIKKKTVDVNLTNSYYRIYIKHINIHIDGYGELKFHYNDGTLDTFRVRGNGGIKVYDDGELQHWNNEGFYDFRSSSYLTTKISAISRVSKNYYIDCLQTTGANTWEWRNLDLGLNKITVMEYSEWGGWRDIQINGLTEPEKVIRYKDIIRYNNVTQYNYINKTIYRFVDLELKNTIEMNSTNMTNTTKNNKKGLEMPLTVLNIALMGVIFVLLCYIWYLKNPCESWCSLYENCSNVYECCTRCCEAFDDDEDKKKRDAEIKRKRKDYRLKQLEKEVQMYKYERDLFAYKGDEDYEDDIDIDEETNKNQNNVKLDIYPIHIKNGKKSVML